jgi:hypothetical protein
VDEPARQVNTWKLKSAVAFGFGAARREYCRVSLARRFCLAGETDDSPTVSAVFTTMSLILLGEGERWGEAILGATCGSVLVSPGLETERVRKTRLETVSSTAARLLSKSWERVTA